MPGLSTWLWTGPNTPPGSIVTMRIRIWRPAMPSLSGPRSTVDSNFTVTPFVSGAAFSLLIVASLVSGLDVRAESAALGSRPGGPVQHGKPHWATGMTFRSGAARRVSQRSRHLSTWNDDLDGIERNGDQAFFRALHKAELFEACHIGVDVGIVARGRPGQ